MRKLGGSIFVHNAISQDYCIKESVECLKELCDEVVVLDAGSTDGTTELVKSLADSKTMIALCEHDEWQAKRKELGREVLSYFSNKAKDFLNTEWYFSLQADEVIHEDSFEAIRNFVYHESGGLSGAYCRRINLWGTTQHKLNVPLHRSPVGVTVLRLARTQYNSIDDAESIEAIGLIHTGLVDLIRVYHMGFVRDKYRHCSKVQHMQESIFQFAEMDKKVQAMDGVFDPWIHFSKSDVVPIGESLPKFVKAWAEERDAINGFVV